MRVISLLGFRFIPLSWEASEIYFPFRSKEPSLEGEERVSEIEHRPEKESPHLVFKFIIKPFNFG